MTSKLFCGLNALMYLGLGAYCAARPIGSASEIGFAFDKPAAEGEYFVVYGGMMLAFAAWFALGAVSAAHRRSVVVFGALLYTALAGFRLLTLTWLPPMTFTVTIGAVEVAMCGWAWRALYLTRDAPELTGT